MSPTSSQMWKQILTFKADGMIAIPEVAGLALGVGRLFGTYLDNLSTTFRTLLVNEGTEGFEKLVSSNFKDRFAL